MSLGAQVSLFGHAGDGDLSLSGLRRIELEDHAWIDHLPNWVEGHVPLFDALLDAMKWRSIERPMYDRIVDVPRGLATIPDDGPGHATIERAREVLSNHYGIHFGHVHMALYRDGRDSVAMHRDKAPDETIVPIVSVGSPRRFVIRRSAGGSTRHFMLGWGDLLVMGGRFQAAWQHGVPKVRTAAPRISVVFRDRQRS